MVLYVRGGYPHGPVRTGGYPPLLHGRRLPTTVAREEATRWSMYTEEATRWSMYTEGGYPPR